MDEEPPRPREAQDAVDALHRLLREERHGEQDGDSGDIGGERRRTGQPTPRRYHGHAIREGHGDQKALADHGQYHVCLRNWPNTDIETSAAADTVHASVSKKEYCIAPTANASAFASSASATRYPHSSPSPATAFSAWPNNRCASSWNMTRRRRARLGVCRSTIT